MAFPVGNTTSMARSVLRLSGSSGLMLAIDPFQAVRIGLAADADPGPLKSSPGLVSSDPLSYLNIVAITRGACSSQSRCSGLWPGNNSQFWSDKNAVAVSCGLYACSRHLRREAINGQFRETVACEELYPKLPPSLWDSRKNVSSEYTEFFPPCWENNTRYDRRPTDIPILRDTRSRLTQFPPCAYGVSPGFRLYVDKSVSTIITGNCTVQVRDPQAREQFDNVRCISAIASLEKIDCMRDTKSLTSTRCNTDSW
jgi:hypothetical protein